MKNILKIAGYSVKLTLLCFIIFTCIYTSLIWGTAQLTQSEGKGEIVSNNEKLYFRNIGQLFTDDKYFYSRPSAVSYDAASSGGSNKGPFNEEYLNIVKVRIDTFLSHNPGIDKSQIPSDLVTASGSGLDPHISLQSALVQVNRISRIRNIKPETVIELIQKMKEEPLRGLLGMEYVNVATLNHELDNLTQ